MGVLLLALAVIFVLWTRESVLHRRALRAIPIRVHINGSRGKSSVTRLAAAALREHGFRTVAKVTGSKARLILPDGSEEPVLRLGTPNICEQVGILDRARREKADALVIECMAVRPDLQKTAEHHIVHATVGVVTNIRPDHLDVMGPTVDDVAIALSSTVPKGAVAVLGDGRYAGLFGRVARERNSTLKVGRPEAVPPGAMKGFAYLEHEENVATVLEITRTLKIPDEVALRGMYKAAPDVGVCSRWDLTHCECRIEFHNIFAANDLESTITVWQKLGMGRTADNGRGSLDLQGSGCDNGSGNGSGGGDGNGNGGSTGVLSTGTAERPALTTVALLNLRADRIDRSLQYAEAVEKGLLADHYVLIGGITASVRRRFADQVPSGRLWVLGNRPAREIFDTISGFGALRARVGGVGNIGGIGHDVLDFVAKGAQG